MRRAALVLVVVVIGALLVLGGFFRPIQIHGYDGLESYVTRVESQYTNVVITPDLPDTSVTWDPPPQGFSPLDDPIGIHIDMNQPQVINYELIDTIEDSYIETRSNGEEWNVSRKWVVQIAHLTQYIHIYTAGRGSVAISNVRVWFGLHENPFSVFSEPDESEAYILNVWSIDQVEHAGGHAIVSPAAKGIDLNPSVVKVATIPTWILEAGYTGQLSNWKDVDYPIDLLSLARGLFGAQTDLEWNIGIDVLLFGYWEQTKRWHETGYDPPNFWDFLGDIWAAIMTPFGVVVVVVAMIATVVLVIRAPRGWLLMFGMVVVWVATFLVLGMIGVSLL